MGLFGYYTQEYYTGVQPWYKVRQFPLKGALREEGMSEIILKR